MIAGLREVVNRWPNQAVMRRPLGGLLVMVVSACRFDSTGVGSSGATFDIDPATTAAADVTNGSGELGGSEDDAETAGVTTDANTDASADASADASTDAGQAPAMLALVDAPEFDFLDVALGAVQTHGFVLRNEAAGTAVGLEAQLDGPGFGFAGGAYPGLGGSCTDTLAGDDSCLLVVAYAPTQWGVAQGTLALDYEDALGVGMVEAGLRARGVGESANLLINGDAEQGGSPPVGWVEGDNGGQEWTTTTEPAFGGERSLWAGPGQGGTSFRLRQSIATESWNLLIDNEGLWFRVRAQTRALFAGDDPHEVWLRFFDARNVLISESGSPPYQGVGWNGVELLAAAPVGTRFVHVQLRCEREFGDNCSGYFDDVSLVASYP